MSKMSDWLANLSVGDRDYALRHLPSHMAESAKTIAKDGKKLSRFLTDFDFIDAKVSAIAPQPLITDYDLALQSNTGISEEKKETLKLIQGAIRLSEKPLTDDSQQLAGQLIGRLTQHAYVSQKIKKPKSSLDFPGVLIFILIGISYIIVLPIAISIILAGLGLTAISRTIKRFAPVSKNSRFSQLSTKLNQRRDNFLTITLNWTSKQQKSLLQIIYHPINILYIIFIDIPIAVINKLFLHKKQRKRIIRKYKQREKLKQVSNPDICALIKQAQISQTTSWLKPLSHSLTSPGGLLFATRECPEVVKTLAITPDGKSIASAWENKVEIWDLQTGNIQQTIRCKDGWIKAIGITPDGKNIVLASYNNIEIWDLQTESLVRELIGHTAEVSTIAISLDGYKLVSGSKDKIVVWDLQTGDILQTLTGQSKFINTIAITPDGYQAVSASDDAILIVWDLNTGNILKTLTGHSEWVSQVVITPDGKKIISASGDKTLIIWDLQTGNILETLTEHSNSVTTVAIAPDGEYFISGSYDRRIILWSLLSTGTAVKHRTLSRNAYYLREIAITPDSTLALSADTKDINIWNFKSNKEEELKLHYSSIRALAITKDGKSAISAADHSPIIWDIESRTPFKTLEWHKDSLECVAITPDGKRTISGSADGKFVVWDLESGLPRINLENFDHPIRAIAITPDGKLAMLAVGIEIIIWDLQLGKKIQVIRYPHNYISAIAVTPDGTKIVSNSSEYDLVLWDLFSGEQQNTFGYYVGYVKAIAITPDGKNIIANSDSTINIWNLQTGNFDKSLYGHKSSIQDLKVSSDGRYLVSASNDRTIKVWNLETGQQITTFTGDNFMCSCEITPDTKTILAGDSLGKVHFLQLELTEY